MSTMIALLLVLSSLVGCAGETLTNVKNALPDLPPETFSFSVELEEYEETVRDEDGAALVECSYALPVMKALAADGSVLETAATEGQARALAAADALDLADRPLPELSGGQRQKAYLAMALAQETEAILMDEPTTFLDIRHQLEVLALVRRLAEEGRGVVLALHDLCLALTAADDVAVLGEGRLLALGGPEAVYQSKVLERVMGVRLDRSEGPGGRRYFCQLPEEG